MLDILFLHICNPLILGTHLNILFFKVAALYKRILMNMDINIIAMSITRLILELTGRVNVKFGSTYYALHILTQ